MDPSKELEEERARRIKLENELAAWHDRALDKLTPEELAQTVQKQQLETLTYNLLKSQQRIRELEVKLRSRDKESARAGENMESLEDELESKTREVAGLEKRIKSMEESPTGQRIDFASIASEEDLDTLLESAVSEPLKKKEPKKTIKDLVHLIRRMERIKLFDASLLLDVSQDEIIEWAEKLKKKGYVTVEGYREKTLVASDKLLKTR